MMTVSPINSIDYYSNLAKDDYYLDGGEPAGKWAGKGALLLGLKGDVNHLHYHNILNGLSPSGNESLCQSGKSHKPGWDLTFSAPKSVSVVWARGDLKLKAEIQEAHEKAIRSAIKLLESEAAYTRRGKDGLFKEKVIGLVASLFEHATSRAQDPQLHTHCLIANVAPRADGTWGTLESKVFYQWQKAIGTSYRAELSHNLRELGFAIEADGDSFGLAGVPKSICEYYSKRSSRIEEELKQRGGIKRASKSGDIVSLSTRAKKSDINRKELYKTWSSELDTLGFSEERLFGIRNASQKQTLADIFEVQVSQQPLSIELLEERLTEKLAVFKKQDIYRVAAEIAQHSGAGLKMAEFYAKEFINQTETICLGIDKKQNTIYTTKSVLKLENDMIETAKRLASCSKFGISNSNIEKAINAKPFLLTEEQQEAIWSACQNNHLNVLQGSAGAGKSASMECVSNAYKSEGFKVIGATLSRAAANNLENEAVIKAHTIAKLLKDIESNKYVLNDKTLIIVDEAGQVGSRQLSKLLQAVEKHGSKAVLVGEDKQLQAIEHGGALKYLSNPKIIGTTRIETIKRQRKEWARQAVADFRDGEVISFLASEYSDENDNIFISQAYASTIYSAQGLTINGDTFVYHTKGMDRANMYVACSRHKDECHIFSTKSEEIDNKALPQNIEDPAYHLEQLAKDISYEGTQTLATSYQEKTKSVSLIQSGKLPNNPQIQM